ncbi:MAG: hypothetical protein WC996_07155 [Peptostreptococcales bacterium]
MKNKDKKGKQKQKPAAYDVKNNKFEDTENCNNCCTNSNNQCSDSKR